MACPNCLGTDTAVVDRASFDSMVVLTYRCGCGHEWGVCYRAPSGTIARTTVSALRGEPRLRIVGRE